MKLLEGNSGFSQMFKYYEEHAPLKRNPEPREPGDAGLFPTGNTSTSTMGQVLYVDCGYEIMGM